MMEFGEIVVKESPGLCRCCLSEGCYKDLGSEYAWMNDTEIYADMLLECFDIGISQHNEGPNGPNRLICEVCITRLRDACNFKKQVVDSEKKFVDMVGRGEFGPKVVIYQTTMKSEQGLEEPHSQELEVEYLDEDMQFDDADDQPLSHIEAEPSGSEDVALHTVKVKGKRGRPKKTAVKTEKKPKMVHLEEKPRSSRAVTKDAFSDISNAESRMVLKKAMSVIINNSTAVPFRWFSNKYMCFYCCLEFNYSSKLRDHNLKEHEDPTLRNALNNCNLTRIKIDIANIKCKKCLKPMTDLQDLVKHLSKNHDYNIDMKDLETIHCFKLSDETMSCLECAQNFTFFGNLLKHVHKCHNKQNPYLCEICGQGFVAKANVDSHIKYVHSRLKTPCVQCGETFPTPYALRAHREKVHRVNNLKCPLCPEIFGSRYLKRSHLAKVHDVKTVQFNCDECNKIFTQRSKLVSHKLTVHLKQRTITCEICGFKVFNQENLKRHIVRHNDDRPFECEYCKKRFQRKKTLQFHIRIHTNDRRYVCKECGKAFVQVTSLKSHVRNHLPAV